MGRAVTVWRKRPFRITYRVGVQKVGRVVACCSPEAVVRSAALMLIRGAADEARVMVNDDTFALMVRAADGAVRFKVF